MALVQDKMHDIYRVDADGVVHLAGSVLFECGLEEEIMLLDGDIVDQLSAPELEHMCTVLGIDVPAFPRPGGRSKKRGKPDPERERDYWRTAVQGKLP